MEELKGFTSCLEADDTVTITISNAQQTFTVSKPLLCQASDYFSNPLNGQFHEAHHRKLSLPGHDSDTIRLFLYWLYREKLPDFRADLNMYEVTEHDNGGFYKLVTDREVLSAKLWVLGDACMIPKLQNTAAKSILLLTSKNSTTMEVVRQVFRLTYKGSPLRELFMDEARFDFFSHFYSAISTCDLEELAEERGFLAEFIGPAKEQIASWNLAMFKCAEELYRDSDELRYMVKED